MRGYVTLLSNGRQRARAFLFAAGGGDWGREVMRLDNGVTMYGTGRGQPTLPMTKPYNGKAAVPGNDTMVRPCAAGAVAG